MRRRRGCAAGGWRARTTPVRSGCSTRSADRAAAARRFRRRPGADRPRPDARALGAGPQWRYGVTHDVFHLTDWGRNRQRLSPELAGYLRLWLPSWLENWLEEELWDLVGELLAVTACLPAAPYDPVAWQRLAGAQAADGSVPEIGAAPATGTGRGLHGLLPLHPGDRVRRHPRPYRLRRGRTGPPAGRRGDGGRADPLRKRERPVTVTAASPALLHGVGDRALTWLDDHREHFRLTPQDFATNGAVIERLKPIGELALNMQVLFREGVAGSRQKERPESCWTSPGGSCWTAATCWPALQHDEPLSPVPLEVYATFHELGHRHPGLEAALEVCRRTTTWTALEMMPNRRLGVLNAERKLGLPPSSDFDRAVDRTWLGQLAEPWTVQLHIAYDLTHTVFHLTNWGEAPERIPPAIADYLTRYLPAWMDGLGGPRTLGSARRTSRRRRLSAAAGTGRGAVGAVRGRTVAHRRDAHPAPDAAGRRGAGLRPRPPPHPGRRVRLRDGHLPGPVRRRMSPDRSGPVLGDRLADAVALIDAPDVVVGVTRNGRRTVMTGGSALAPPTPRHALRYELGSLSKTFTVLLLADLARVRRAVAGRSAGRPPAGAAAAAPEFAPDHPVASGHPHLRAAADPRRPDRRRAAASLRQRLCPLRHRAAAATPSPAPGRGTGRAPAGGTPTSDWHCSARSCPAPRAPLTPPCSPTGCCAPLGLSDTTLGPGTTGTDAIGHRTNGGDAGGQRRHGRLRRRRVGPFHPRRSAHLPRGVPLPRRHPAGAAAARRPGAAAATRLAQTQHPHPDVVSASRCAGPVALPRRARPSASRHSSATTRRRAPGWSRWPPAAAAAAT